MTTPDPSRMRARHAAERRAAFMEREGWPLQWQVATFALDIRPAPQGDRQKVG